MDKSLSIDTGHHEKLYQERMNFLLTGEKDRVCSIYIDVTDNKMLAIITRKHKYNYNELNNISVRCWLDKYIYPNISDGYNLEEFKNGFTRKALLEGFEKGERNIQFYHSYYDENGNLKLYKVRVSLIENPYNGHIEAYAVWKDRTLKYIDKEISRILYNNDYIGIGIIDSCKGNLYMRAAHFEGMEVEEQKSYVYDDIVKQMSEIRIANESKEQFLKCTALDYLNDNMNIAGVYSFNVYNIKNKVERYSYHWFDKKKGIILVVIEDMTKELETDSVTGALNREGFVHKAENIIKNNPDKDFALLYFNIQKFKAINDLYGYAAGDTVLHQAVNILQISFLKPLAISRIEADRFVVLVDKNNLDFEKLTSILHRVYDKDGMKVDIYVRCGIYYIPKDTDLSVSDMCDRAKLAKLYIPNQYVQPYAIFNEDMKYDYEQRSLALIQLDDAIKNSEIKVFYQPIYDAKTKQIASAEALVRWVSPKGVILPGKFIPALEESGHITKLDTYVHKSVRRFMENRYKNGKKIVRVAVNLSRMDLMDGEIMDLIIDDVKDEHYSKQMVNYEVTESAYANVSGKGTNFLNQLHDNGVKLLIDDFGSGMSSFSTLRDYNFDVIKLDMGFVQKLGENKKYNNIVMSIIELAHRLDMKVVAEGVETKEQADYLKEYGCDYLQGFYFSKPLPEEEFAKLLD